jgi:hypothetical protein
MNMKSKGESPSERLRPRPRKKKLKNILNEVMPFLTFRTSVPIRSAPACFLCKWGV